MILSSDQRLTDRAVGRVRTMMREGRGHLRPAEDALIIDSSALSVDEVLNRVLEAAAAAGLA